MDYTQLIVAIISSFAQYGPALVKSVTDLVHGNPQKQGETDDAYIGRLNAEIDAKAADTTAGDRSVIEDAAAPASQTPSGGNKFNVA